MSAESSGYSRYDILKMQREAVERVREMQRRARRTLEGPPAAVEAAGTPRPVLTQPPQAEGFHPQKGPIYVQYEGEPPHRARGYPPQHRQTAEHGRHTVNENMGGYPKNTSSEPSGGLLSQVGSFLTSLGLDNDRLLILILLFVLWGEGADKTLLLALCYLLL